MANAFLGEIRMFGGTFAPSGWALCDGRLVAIAQNDALFALLGTTYGGDGQNTFALPDLRGRVPIHQGQGPGLGQYVIGQQGGTESVTLTGNQIPVHTHAVQASRADGDQTSPANAVLAGGGSVSRYLASPPATAMSANSVGGAGGSQPHQNLQPTLAVTFIIALQGIFPSRN